LGDHLGQFFLLFMQQTQQQNAREGSGNFPKKKET
jgi:hypothetical protein